MKKIYIAPETDIQSLCLHGSVLADTAVGEYSNTTDWAGTNSVTFDDEESEDGLSASSSLWDE